MSKQFDEVLNVAVNNKLTQILTPESQIFLMQTWYRYMFKYIPYDTGALASTMNIKERKRMSPQQAQQMGESSINTDNSGIATVKISGGRTRLPAEIRFKVPYAHRIYNGTYMNFKRDMHPNACARWGEVSKNLYGAQIGKEFNEFIRR